jgi:septal ring factor EnvC (AmiA/AmiB activator)
MTKEELGFLLGEMQGALKSIDSEIKEIKASNTEQGKRLGSVEENTGEMKGTLKNIVSGLKATQENNAEQAKRLSSVEKKTSWILGKTATVSAIATTAVLAFATLYPAFSKLQI